jgi:hypothetical protein
MPNGRGMIIAFPVVTPGPVRPNEGCTQTLQGHFAAWCVRRRYRPSIKRAHTWGVQLFTTTTETSDEIIISRPIPVHPRRAFCLRSLLGPPLIASAVDHYKDAHVPTGTNSTTGPLDTGI